MTVQSVPSDRQLVIDHIQSKVDQSRAELDRFQAKFAHSPMGAFNNMGETVLKEAAFYDVGCRAITDMTNAVDSREYLKLSIASLTRRVINGASEVETWSGLITNELKRVELMAYAKLLEELKSAVAHYKIDLNK